MPGDVPRTTVKTKNGTAVRNRAGWTWLCKHCHRVSHVGGLEEGGLDPQAWADDIDSIHWCEHKE